MVQTITKNKLSGSTDGLQIKVTGTNTGTADTIHTAVSGTSNYDEVWIWADNSSASTELLTIEFGGTTDPDNIIEVNLAGLGTPSSDGLKLIVPGLIIDNSKVIKAFSANGNVVKLSGYVNEIRG